MLKRENKTLKEENSKLRHDMCEKDIPIKCLMETLNKKGQIKVGSRNQTNAKTSTWSKYTIRHEKQICSTSRYYIVSSLTDETPERIILHGGFNDVNNKNSSPEKIGNKIADMVLMMSLYQRWFVEKVNF